LPIAVTQKCKEISDYVEKREQDFVSDVASHVVKTMNPACTGWTPYAKNDPRQKEMLEMVRDPEALDVIASGFVVKAALQCGKALGSNEIGAMAKDLKDHAGASIRLYREILERLVNTGCDLTKPERANWIWDMQIAFAIGADWSGDFGTADSLLLVTADDAMVQAAGAASLGSNVLSLMAYLDGL
jgi:hypothetical protein